MAYDYWWGYTCAQIELMIADQPFVSYKNKKEKKATKSEMDNLADEWLARKQKEKEDSVNNPMEGFKGSKKTTMSEFFKEK